MAGQIAKVSENEIIPGNESLVSASLSEVTLVPNTTILADGSSFVEISILLLDARGQPVPGVLVEIRSTGEQNLISYAHHVSSFNGTITAGLSSFRAEIKTIVVVITVGQGELMLLDSPTVEFRVIPGPDNLRIENFSQDQNLSTCSWNVVWDARIGQKNDVVYEICKEGSGPPTCVTLASGVLTSPQLNIPERTNVVYTITAIQNNNRADSDSVTQSCGVIP